MKHLGINIHKENPEYVNEFSEKLLTDYYVREGETIPKAFARAATAFCYGDYGLAQRVYDAAYKGWFMFASPILSNAPEGAWENGPYKHRDFWIESFNRNSYWSGTKEPSMPISCYLLDCPDNIVGQMDVQKEIAALSVAGGGVGAHNSIRAVTSKAPGPIPFMKVLDASIGYFRQSLTRRGSMAYYMDVNHPDIVEFIKFRVPSGGDSGRKADNRTQFHNAVNVTDEFIEAVLKDEKFNLVCPHSGDVRDTVNARDIWEDILETRALTGEPYIFKIDAERRTTPKTQLDKGLAVKGSNLC